jgi:hypothetical protein
MPYLGVTDLFNKIFNSDNNSVNVSQNGSIVGINTTPATGTKTITSTAAEIFAGTSRKADRAIIYIRNTHDSIAIRVGADDVTDVKGRRILPQTEEKIEINPVKDIPIYAISEYGDVKVEVFEA